MVRKSCFVLLLLGTLPLFARTWADNRSSAPDAKSAIRKVLDDQSEAWNRGDLEAFMAGYWNSSQLTFFSGKDRMSGWQATIERYRKRYQSAGHEMGKLTFSGIEIEPLGPESAFVRGQWKVVTTKETLSGLFTLVFKKQPEGWRIVHDHTSG
jgi:beta-aspartyl-peptidase (threonine type)